MNSEVQNNLVVISGSFDKKRRELENRSDADIWRQFKMGDETAFIFIYEKYFDRLVNYCYQFTQNEELIKDCVQDLFIFIRKKRTSVSHTDNISLYLFKSCRNRLIDYLKKSLKIKTLNEIEENLFIPTLSPEEHIIDLQSKAIKEKRLKEAIGKLSLREREIIYYFYYENLDYQAIAELMKYEHVKSVRTLLYRALDKLKDLFVVFIAYSFYHIFNVAAIF